MGLKGLGIMTSALRMDKQMKLEILEGSYWEHFKYAKDLALILPLNHSKRKRIEAEVDRLQKEIHDLVDKDDIQGT